MKKTAVEWLYNNLKSHFEHNGDLLEVVQMSFNQAKEMEKEQIEIAFFKGDLFAEDYFDADNPTEDVSENYYKQTYENNN